MGLRAALANAPLSYAIQGTMDVNVALRVCQNLFLQPVFKFISWRTVFVRPGNKTWMTSDLFRLSRQKHRSFKAACRSQSEKAWQDYKKIRNQCNSAFDKAKRLHHKKMCSKLSHSFPGNPSWRRTVKQLSRLSTKESNVPDLQS